MRHHALIACTLVFAAATMGAQTFTTQPCKDATKGSWFGSSETACEVRSVTLPLSHGGVKLQNQNGSIEIVGEDRQDVALEARVGARGHDQAESDAILHEITIETRGTIEANGPRQGDGRNWSVSYKLRVPHRLAARLETTNGSLSLTALDGDIHAETTNGSVKLADLAGKVNVTTTNGSIKGSLAGSTWQGSGLSASTTNGSIAVAVPQRYSAHLVASTSNGRVAGPEGVMTDSSHKGLDTTIGSGGATLTFETTNGSVSLR